MEKLIIILSVFLVLGIIAFGAYQFKKLRRNQANLKSANIQGQDADRIVYAYRVEENYVRQRSRIWLLTILASAFVILTGSGSAYYLHNKDIWAAERVEKAQRKAQEKALAEKATREAKAKASAEKAAREAKAKASAEKAAREAKAKASAEKKAREAKAKASAEKAAREAKAKAPAKKEAKGFLDKKVKSAILFVVFITACLLIGAWYALFLQFKSCNEAKSAIDNKVNATENITQGDQRNAADPEIVASFAFIAIVECITMMVAFGFIL